MEAFTASFATWAMPLARATSLSARSRRSGLRQLLERLAPEERPVLVRGDNAFGNEGVMTEME